MALFFLINITFLEVAINYQRTLYKENIYLHNAHSHLFHCLKIWTVMAVISVTATCFTLYKNIFRNCNLSAKPLSYDYLLCSFCDLFLTPASWNNMKYAAWCTVRFSNVMGKWYMIKIFLILVLQCV
jgi:hypothetical protein